MEYERTNRILLFSLSLLFGILVVYIKVMLAYKGHVNSDCSYYANCLWNTDLHSKLLYSEMCQDRFGVNSFLNDHFSPTLIILAPIYQFFQSPILLLVIQGTTPIFSAILIHKIIQSYIVIDNLSSMVFSILLPIAYLYNTSTLNATIDWSHGFHHDCLIPPLIFTTIYTYIIGHKKLSFLSIILLAGMKEDLPFLLLIGGVYIYLTDKDHRQPAKYVIAVSILFILSCILYQYLTIGQAGTIHLQQNETYFMFKTPINGLISLTGYWFIILLFFPIFGKRLILLAFPEMILYSYRFDAPYEWHSFVVIAILFLSSIYGFRNIDKPDNKELINFGLICLLASCALGLYAVTDICIRYSNLPFLNDYRDTIEIPSKILTESNIITTTDLKIYFANRQRLAESVIKDTIQYIVVNPRLKNHEYSQYCHGIDSKIFNYITLMLNKNEIELVMSDTTGIQLWKVISPKALK